MPITIAGTQDISQLVALLNRAYRGDASRMGWTTEADVVGGKIRTDEPQATKMMAGSHATFLKATNVNEDIVGCVYLEKRDDRLYLGMLSVDPSLQAKGTGKELMKAAEIHATQAGCKAIFMRVVSTRYELIAWYERQGYYKTGEVQPFEDSIYGTAKQPIEFVVMQKDLL